MSTSEVEILYPIAEHLRREYGGAESFCALFVGYTCEGRQIDATLLRPDAIINIEVKDYTGKIAACDSQGNISIKPNEIRVNKGRSENPFEQVKQQNYGIKNFIAKHVNELLAASKPQIGQPPSSVDVCGFVVFRSIESFDTSRLGPSNRYFKLADSNSFITESAKYHSRPWGNWSNRNVFDRVFIEKLANLLGLDEVREIVVQRDNESEDQRNAATAHLHSLVQAQHLGGVVSRIRPMAALLDNPKVLLVGPTGSGKTTLLKMFVRDTARGLLAKGEISPLPCFVPLGESGISIEKVAVECGFSESSDVMPNLIRGNCLIVLDGIDEMQSPKRSLFGLVDFIRKFPENRYVLSVRTEMLDSRDYVERFRLLKDFKRVEIGDLSNAEQTDLLHTLISPEQSRGREGDIATFLKELPDSTPLTMKLAAEMITRSTGTLLPIYENRGLFYMQYFEAFLGREVAKSDEVSDGGQFLLMRALSDIAGTAVKRQNQYLPAEDVFDVLRSTIGGNPVPYWGFLLKSGILVERKMTAAIGRNRIPISAIQFAHPSYLSFFAANAIVHSGEFESVLESVESHPLSGDVLIMLCGITRDSVMVENVIRELLLQEDRQLAVDCFCNSTNVSPQLVQDLAVSIESGLSRNANLDITTLTDHPAIQEWIHFSLRNAWHYGARFASLVSTQMEKFAAKNMLVRIDWEIVKSERLKWGRIDPRYLHTYRGAAYTEGGIAVSSREKGLVLGVYECLGGCLEAQTEQGYSLYQIMSHTGTIDDLYACLIDPAYGFELKGYILAKLVEDYELGRDFISQLDQVDLLFGPYGERYMWVVASLVLDGLRTEDDEPLAKQIEEHFWKEPSPIVQARFLRYMEGTAFGEKWLRLCIDVCDRYQNDQVVNLPRIDSLFEFHVASTGDVVFEGGDPVVLDLFLRDFEGETYGTLMKCFALARIAEAKSPLNRATLERMQFSENFKIRRIAERILETTDETSGTM